MATTSRTPKPQVVNPEVLLAYLTGVQEDLKEIKATTTALSTAVLGITRLEERQLKLIEDINRANTGYRDLDKRISDVEVHMPGLIELRKWVVTGVVSAIGILMLSVGSLIIRGA